MLFRFVVKLVYIRVSIRTCRKGIAEGNAQFALILRAMSNAV